MHQVRFGGLHSRRKMEADHHSDTSDSEETDDEELRTTLLKQRQRISLNTAAVPASRPNNTSNPIPSSPLSVRREDAEPARDNDAARALMLHHSPCHAPK